MDVRFCKTCGAPLIRKDAYTWECNYCRNTYSDSSVQEEAEALLRALLSENKIEQVANLRRNLYDALNAAYTDSDEICGICSKIKALLPDDFAAGFYYTANRGTSKEICSAIRAIDPQKNADAVCGIISHMLSSMRSEYALPLQNLVERAYKNTDVSRFEEFSTLISNEAEKVNAGIYETAVPRDVFVAYSSKDMDIVEDLVEYIESSGLDCFVAARNLRHGRGAKQNYEKALHEAIDNCKCVVFVSSENSRSMECDALRVELKYIKNTDTLNAPAEYRKSYSSIPSRYKMNRIEYRIDNKRSQPYAEKVLSEFFSGLEHAYSPEEIVDRIYNFDNDIPNEPEKKEPIHEKIVYCPYCGAANPLSANICGKCGKTLREVSKFCTSCGSENAESAKFCNECGNDSFVPTRADYNVLLKKKMEDQQRLIKELQDKLNSSPKQPERPSSPRSDELPSAKASSSGKYEVYLKSCGSAYLNTIKIVREATGLSLKDAKELVYSAPVCIASLSSKETAYKLASDLREAGASVDIYPPKDISGGEEIKRKSDTPDSAGGTGDPVKLYELGCNYYYGRNGVAKDAVRAFECFERGAVMGYAKSQNFLGFFYETGFGVPKDYNKCYMWYKKAAEQGFSVAQSNLGLCYEYERGVSKDLYEAFKWYKKAAEQGYKDAQNRVGICYENGKGVEKNLPEAVKWYKKAAEQGNAIAQKCLGTCYKFGKGITKDLNEAFKWYKKAAEQGNAIAQNSLGACYENGEGTPKDLGEAIKWYKRSAEQGDPLAQCNLGLCYEFGKGTAKDLTEAFKWYKKSAEQGNAIAQCNLGLCYEYAKGTAKELNEAFKWYKRSAEQGNAAAQNNLGICYEHEKGVEKNLAEAFKWYKKSAEQGNASAQNSLALCYELEKGTSKDLYSAFKWYEKSADGGNKYALRNLGLCYEFGKGTLINYGTALSYYRKASEKGYEGINTDIERCRKKQS